MIKGQDYIGVSAIPFLHDGKGHYLVGLRTDKCRDEHFTWEPLGGGGVKFGEKIEDAVLREVKEETGATPFKLEYLGMREAMRIHQGKQTHWIVFDYRAEVDPVEVEIIEPDKCAEIRWCTIEEIPEPRHSQFEPFLKNYEGKL